MPSMPLRSVPGYRPRHAFGRDPTSEHPAVRVYPAIPWMPGHQEPCWVHDIGEDISMPVVGPFRPGASHRIDDDELDLFGEDCDVCKRRKAFRYDDFFGNVCTMCEITHPLRYKARGVNPWGGKL